MNGGLAFAFHTKHAGIFYCWMVVQCLLKVLGVYVHSACREDHVLGPALYPEVPLGVELADIAGPVPAILEILVLQVGPLVISRGYVVPLDQDLSLFGEFEVLVRQIASDRSRPRIRHGIAGHDGGCFGQTVALDDLDPDAVPETLCFRIQGSAAHGEELKLAPELLMKRAKQYSPCRPRQQTGQFEQGIE